MVFQNFIVLGIIPGTNIQINFQLWLIVMLVAVVLWQYRHLVRRKFHATVLAMFTFEKNITTHLRDISDITL